MSHDVVGQLPANEADGQAAGRHLRRRHRDARHLAGVGHLARRRDRQRHDGAQRRRRAKRPEGDLHRAASILDPHDLQKRASASLAVPQDGHVPGRIGVDGRRMGRRRGRRGHAAHARREFPFDQRAVAGAVGVELPEQPGRPRAQPPRHLVEVGVGDLPHRAVELHFLDRAQHEELLAFERGPRAAAEHLGLLAHLGGDQRRHGPRGRRGDPGDGPDRDGDGDRVDRRGALRGEHADGNGDHGGHQQEVPGPDAALDCRRHGWRRRGRGALSSGLVTRLARHRQPRLARDPRWYSPRPARGPPRTRRRFPAAARCRSPARGSRNPPRSS